MQSCRLSHIKFMEEEEPTFGSILRDSHPRHTYVGTRSVYLMSSHK